MAAKSLAFLLVAILFYFGYPPGTYVYGQYEDDNSSNLDVHTDSNEFGYNFIPDESDINYDELAMEQKQMNSYAKEQHGEHGNLEHTDDESTVELSGEEDAENAENQDKVINEDGNEKDSEHSQNNEGHDVIKNEGVENPDKIAMEDLKNKKLREDLLRAEHNDNIQKINEVNGNKRLEEIDNNNNNNNNNHNNEKNNGQSNERPIKEIHDTIEARGHHHIIHKGHTPLEQDTNKHEANHNSHKEQKVKISKLIFAAKKNAEDVKHSDTSSSLSEKQDSQPIAKNAEPSPTPKTQAWVNEIVTSDGGLLHLQQNTKKVDIHKDSNGHEEVLKVKVNEQKDYAEPNKGEAHHHKESERDPDIQQKEKTDPTNGENGKHPEGVVHKDQNIHVDHNGQHVVHHGGVPLKQHADDKQDSGGEQSNTVQEQTNDKIKQEGDNVNQINESGSERAEDESEEEKDDKRILALPKFQTLQKRYILQYLNDHYSGQNISEKLLNQITDLITNDLKQQWREREKEALRLMEEREKQKEDAIQSAKNSEMEEKEQAGNNGKEDKKHDSQEEDEHVENRKESEDQRQDSKMEEKQQESSNERKDQRSNVEARKDEDKTLNEERERKSKIELINKPSTEKSRPTKSILSNMLRSSLSLPVHDKSHDSSMVTARSSPLPVAMDMKDSSGSDTINLSPASTRVDDILSTETSHNEADSKTRVYNDDTVDSTKRNDDSYTDIFADEDKDQSEIKEIMAELAGNDIKQGDNINLAKLTKIEPINVESIPKDKMFKAGEPFNLSFMSDPDPKINKLMQLPMFQKLRKQQVESYIDAQFAGKYISEEELKNVDEIISESMRKDLHTEGSGLHGWIKDSMGGDDTEEETMDPQVKTEHNVSETPEINITEESDSLASKDTVSNDKSEPVPVGMLQGAVDLMKSKKNNWMKILAGSHQNTSTLPANDNTKDDISTGSVKGEEENIVQDGSDEHNRNDSEDSEIKKQHVEETAEDEIKEEESTEEPAKGYLDTIWSFFGSSSEENIDTETDKDIAENKLDGNAETGENVEDMVIPPDIQGEGDEATASEDDENLVLAVAEDDEGETETSNQDNISTQTTEQLEATHPQNTSEEMDSVSTTLQPTSGEDLKIAEADVKTSELVVASEEDEVGPISATHLPEGSTNTTADTTPGSESGSAKKFKPNLSGVSSDSEASTQSPSKLAESVDLDHEKSKYKEGEHKHAAKDDVRKESVLAEEEEGEIDPLTKLCRKYPSLKACQVPPTPPTPTREENTTKMDFPFLLYIKYFTRSLNGFFYGAFEYAVQSVKSLVKILCYYTIGTFLNIFGREEVSHSMNEMFDSTTTEYFAVIMFLVINHTVFYWYFKNSTMHPVVKVTDGFNDLDNKQLQVLEDQLNELKIKMAEETEEKENVREQVEKEIEINQKMHNENKELKIYMEENKGDKKRIKELERSNRDHENRIKGKDVELEKLRVSIDTVKDDMKGQKDGYKELEEKFRYVEKELDSKDQTLYDMEENKKEMTKELNGKNEDITEKTDMLKDLNERVSSLQSKQSDMENSIKVEKELAESLEGERKALQETLLNIDKLNYEGKLENGFHSERIEDEDGVLNVSLDEDVKAERLQNIINAIKLKAEHLEAVNQLATCKEDLSRYRKKSDDLEANMNNLSSKFETLSSESDDLRKSIEKKDIELQTITKFFGEREADFHRQNVSQKEELRKLSKQMDSIDEEKREMSDLIKKIDDLKEEISNNDKDYKQQLATLEEQSHSNYLKMRTALRECDEHKREKEVYRKRLLDIDMAPQAKTKAIAATKPVGKERSDSPSSDKSNELLNVNDPSKLPSPSEPTHPTLPPLRQPFAPQMFHGPGFRPNPMAAALYRVPPVGPYSMPPRPQFMPPMRPPVPHNLLRNPSNAPMNRPNAPVNLLNTSIGSPNTTTSASNIPLGTINAPMSVCNAPMGAPYMTTSNISMSAPNVPIGAPNAHMNPSIAPGYPYMTTSNISMSAPNVPIGAPNAHMNPSIAPGYPYGASMNTSYTNLQQPGMVPYSYNSAGQRPMFPSQDGQRMSTPPRMPYGMHGAPMRPPNAIRIGGHPTNNAMAGPPPPNVTLKTS